MGVSPSAANKHANAFHSCTQQFVYAQNPSCWVGLAAPLDNLPIGDGLIPSITRLHSAESPKVEPRYPTDIVGNFRI